MIHGQKKDAYFSRVFKVSLLISLFLVAAVLYLFPRFEALPDIRNETIQVKIYVSDIPVTRQEKLQSSPPRRPIGVIPVPGEEAELPDQFVLDKFTELYSTPETLADGLPAEIPAKPLLDVYPDLSGTSCRGIVRLLLLVNKSGRVESVELLENSTGSPRCLRLAKEAARRSRWLPAKVRESAVSSWVVKTYKFNLEK